MLRGIIHKLNDPIYLRSSYVRIVNGKYHCITGPAVFGTDYWICGVHYTKSQYERIMKESDSYERV